MYSHRQSKQIYLKDFFLLFAAICLFITAGILNRNNVKPVIELSKQDSAININQNILLFLSVGNKRLLADTLWIQTLLESDEEHYKKKDLNSWMFLRFLSISVLDPLFYENYLYGGLYLSVVKDDIDGASDIYNKGLRYYPDDYDLNYNNGFNYYFEKGEYEQGLKYLEKVQNHKKAPPFIKTLINKLNFEKEGNFEVALELLKNQFNITKDEMIKKKLKGDIYSLQAEFDLICLNKQSTNCNKKDIDGDNYILKNGTWVAPKPFNLYRVHSRQKR